MKRALPRKAPREPTSDPRARRTPCSALRTTCLHACDVLVEAHLLIGTKHGANALTCGLHDRDMTRPSLVLREPLVAKRLVLRLRLRDELPHRGRLRGVEVQVLLHACNTRLGVTSRSASLPTFVPTACTAAASMLPTHVLPLCGRCILRGGEHRHAERERCEGDEHGDAIA
jgi:hypothetical protein